jgi:predicted O-linked N-acetylglucosamine transferase (SPINDLY family)/glycosyltransferase involved in cell wall biosynthesis
LYEQLANYDMSRQHHAVALTLSKELNKPLSYQITAMLNFISAELKHSSLITHDQVRLWINDCEEYINLLQQSSASSSPSSLGSTSESEQASEQSFSPLNNKSHVELLFHLGLLYDRIGNYYKSVKSFEKVVNLDYNHLLSWLNIGNYFFKIRDFSQAIYYYSIGYNICLEQLNQKYSQHPTLSIYDPFFRTDYYHILSITNNLGQSYREQGQLRQSLSIFLSSYNYSKIMHVMNNPAVALSSDSTISSDIDASGLESLRLLSSRRKKQSKFSLYTLITMYTIKGLLNDWKEYEYLEELIKQQISFYQDDIRFSFLSSSVSEDSEFHYPLAHSENGNSIFDPYTLSLLPSVSADFDFFICQQNCPVQDLTSLKTMSTGSSTTSSSLSYFLYNASRYTEKHQDIIHYLAASDKPSFSTGSSVPIAAVNPIIIRIGYLSFDWRDHPMGRLTAAITTLNISLSDLSNSSSAGDVTFEIYCFSYGFHDMSEIRYFIEKHCSFFIDLFSMRKTDYELSQVIASYSIDLLYDITSHTYHNRMKILSFRPAAIMINYLGFPGTTGCISNHFVTLGDKEETSDLEGREHDDYMKPVDVKIHYPASMEYNFTIVDLFVAPPDYLIQRKPTDTMFLSNMSLYYKVFSEKLIYLPFSYQANYMPLTVFHRSSDKQKDLIKRQTGRKIRACVLNSGKKFEPTFFHTLTNIFQRLPFVSLSFLDITSQGQEEIIKQLAFYGISALPSISRRRQRIRFLARESWKSHLLRIQEECDIVLDTFIYGGHTTSTDVLWMGIPIITLRGYGLSNGIRMPSRIASSLIENIDETVGPTSNERSEKRITKRRNKLSELLTYDSIKDYENGLPRLSSFPPSVQRSTSRLDSVSSLILSPSPVMIESIQNRILSISCISPIFNKDLMNEIFLYKYQLLFERYLFHEFISKKEKQYHYVMLKESMMKVIEKKEKGNYCLTESHNLLSLIEERTNYLENSNRDVDKKLIVNEKNPLSFHMKEENLLSYDGWLKRLSYSASSCSSSVGRAGGQLFLETERNKVMDHVSLCRHQYVLFFYNISGFIPHSTMNEENVRTLVSHVLNISNPAEASSKSTYDLYPASSLLAVWLDAIHIELTKYNNNSSSSMGHLLKHSQSNWFFFLNEFQQQVIHSSNSKEALKVNQTFFVNLELAFTNYLFPNLITSSSKSTFDSLEALFSFVETIDWESHSSNLEKHSIVSPFSSSFRHLLHKIFLNSYELLFAETSSLSSLSFSSSPPSASSGLCSTQKKSLLRSHIDYLIYLLSNPIKKDMDISILLHEFFQKYAILMLYEEDLLKLFESIFQFGIYWTSLTKDTSRKVGHDVSIGYLFQSIGNRLLLSKRQDAFLLSLSPEEEKQKQQILLEKENNRFDNNPVIVLYCYEYGQEWWPHWGPSSFDSALHTIDIPSTKQQLDEKNPELKKGKAVGGSEEAVVYLAYELAKYGYNIEIYTDIPLEDRYFTSYQSSESSAAAAVVGKVQWFHYLDFNVSRSIDVFISWRYALSLSLSLNSKRRYLWLHDLVPKESLLPFEKLLSSSVEKKKENGMIIDGIFVQSSFHKRYICNEYRKFLRPMTNQFLKCFSSYSEMDVQRIANTVMILPNGVHTFSIPSSEKEKEVEEEKEELIENDSNIFIYSSSPNRGLEIVLRLWKYILSVNSNAQLLVFYGFTSKVIDHLTQQMTKEAFLLWYEQIQVLLKQPGIMYYGAVSHNELAKSMKKGGFLLYPSSFPETGCITMMKAMIAGIIPITSHYSNSVLAELGEEYDFGPHSDKKSTKSELSTGEVHPFLNQTFHRLTPEILSNGTKFHYWAIEDYLRSVIATIDFAMDNPERLKQIREQMKKKMVRKFSWKNSARLIKEYLNL